MQRKRVEYAQSAHLAMVYLCNVVAEFPILLPQTANSVWKARHTLIKTTFLNANPVMTAREEMLFESAANQTMANVEHAFQSITWILK